MLKTARQTATVAFFVLILGFLGLGFVIRHQQNQPIDRIALTQYTEALLSHTSEAKLLADQSAAKRSFETFQTVSVNHIYNAVDDISSELTQRDIEPEVKAAAENILDTTDQLLEILAGLQQTPGQNEIADFSQQLQKLTDTYRNYEEAL